MYLVLEGRDSLIAILCLLVHFCDVGPHKQHWLLKLLYLFLHSLLPRCHNLSILIFNWRQYFWLFNHNFRLLLIFHWLLATLMFGSFLLDLFVDGNSLRLDEGGNFSRRSLLLTTCVLLLKDNSTAWVLFLQFILNFLLRLLMCGESFENGPLYSALQNTFSLILLLLGWGCSNRRFKYFCRFLQNYLLILQFTSFLKV